MPIAFGSLNHINLISSLLSLPGSKDQDNCRATLVSPNSARAYIMGILGIPNELVFMIGDYLPIEDLANFLGTCRRLSSALTVPLYKRDNLESGRTALQWAAENGNISLVKLAISRGAEIDKPNDIEYCQTALHSAAAGNHPEVIRILVDNGAKTTAKNEQGSTPLHLAALCESLEAMSALLDLEADMMCRNDDGDTPAHYSAVGLYYMVPSGLRLFIDSGFDPSTRGCRDKTILHTAAEYDNVHGVKYLLRQQKVGIPINARDSDGKTPLDCVRGPRDVEFATAAHTEIVQLLTAATEQVEGGREHTCLHGCYHKFSLSPKRPRVS